MPTHSSSFNTPLHGGRFCHNIHIWWGCFVGLDTCREAIHHSGCIFGIHWVGFIFLCSFDVALRTLADKVLVYILYCQNAKLFRSNFSLVRKLPIWVFMMPMKISFFFFFLRHELSSGTMILMSRFFLNVGVEHNTRGWARSNYQRALIPCK